MRRDPRSMRGVSTGEVSTRLTAQVLGDAELIRKLEGLQPRMHERLFKKAVRPALTGMMKDAKQRVRSLPVKVATNQVRKAIAAKIMIRTKGRSGSRYKTRGRLAVFYGQSAKQRTGTDTPNLRATLAHLIEYGFRLTHLFGRKIRPRKIEAKPFMTPAFKDNKDSAEALFVKAVRDQIREEGI
jgi:HK97 gp10 family phage protein